MTSRVLLLLLLMAAAVACAMVTAKIPRVGAAQAQRPGGPPGQRASGHKGLTRPGKAAHLSYYWRAERNLVAALKREGRLGAEVRRLRRHERVRTLQARQGTEATIRLVFASHGDEAVRVSSCETGGTFSPWATNGQYVNIFQMGYSERQQYGWHVAGSPVLVATLAAYRYFLATGSDWSPWECKP